MANCHAGPPLDLQILVGAFARYASRPALVVAALDRERTDRDGILAVAIALAGSLASFNLIATILLVHALAAATQDVAIDAYCISTTAPGERGAYNGWMQTGMLLGRGVMGGGALVMSTYLGDRFVIGLLIALTMFSLLLVVWIPQTPIQSEAASHQDRLRQIGRSLWIAITHRNTWVGLLFGATAGAAFKSLEVFYGPYLIDRGVSQDAIGWFSMGPMIGMMIMGSMLGGRLADRVRRKAVRYAWTGFSCDVHHDPGRRRFIRSRPNRLVCFSLARLGGSRHRIFYSSPVHPIHGYLTTKDCRHAVQCLYGINQWMRSVVQFCIWTDHCTLWIFRGHAEHERHFAADTARPAVLVELRPGRPPCRSSRKESGAMICFMRNPHERSDGSTGNRLCGQAGQLSCCPAD